MIEVDKGKEGNTSNFNRRDFIRGALALAMAASASACAPVKRGDPIDPMLPSVTEVVPLGNATPFPEGNYVAEGEIKLTALNDSGAFAKQVESFNSSEVNWYDSENNLQIKKGAESDFVLLGVLDVQINGSLSTSTFGYVTGPGGEEHIAQKVNDDRWVVLSYQELSEPNGNTLNAFGYPSKNIFLPILSLEVTPAGEPHQSWFFDISVNRFYKINDPDQHGKSGMLSLIQLANVSIIQGKNIMQDNPNKDWNFAWQEDGALTIVTGKSREILYTYDESDQKWVEAVPDVKEYQICSVENYKDCIIPIEDLFDGSYLKWLQTLSKPFEHPENLKDLTSKLKIGEMQMFGPMNGDPSNKFDNPETAPLRRGVTAGYTTLNSEGNPGYIVLPIEFYSPNSPGGSEWVITVVPLEYTSQSLVGLKDWKNDDIFILVANENVRGGDVVDPLVARSFDLYPDMKTRIADFAATGDPNSLSKPGILLETVLTF